jgi:hypothetical protein
LFFFI